MPLAKPPLVRHAAAFSSATRAPPRRALHTNPRSPPFPVVPSCPSPSCACAATPAGLDIDVSKSLNGTMSPYAQHLLMFSGQQDWASKIEDERNTATWGQVTADLKTALGRRGPFHDPYNNILISTASFPTTKSTAVLFPKFDLIEVPSETDGLADFVRTNLLPETLHPSYANIPEKEKALKTRRSSSDSQIFKSQSIKSPTILICSHMSRDSRCGVLGPLLHAEFARYLTKQHTEFSIGGTLNTTATTSQDSDSRFVADDSNCINLGLISHIGGHKWAGNVILYIPPKWMIANGDAENKSLEKSASPLAGMGIWYGRVEPRHVEGIVEETLLRGRVIQDLFRGGIAQDGQILRLGDAPNPRDELGLKAGVSRVRRRIKAGMKEFFNM